MNKMLIPLLILLVIAIPASYADEDDDEYEDDEREGFGIMEREREREHQDDEGSIPLGSDTGNIILYGTIAAIIASVGYTAFKIISTKRKPSPSLK